MLLNDAVVAVGGVVVAVETEAVAVGVEEEEEAQKKGAGAVEAVLLPVADELAVLEGGAVDGVAVVSALVLGDARSIEKSYSITIYNMPQI